VFDPQKPHICELGLTPVKDTIFFSKRFFLGMRVMLCLHITHRLLGHVPEIN